MKKFLKFLFTTFAFVGAILGLYYVIKNVINKDNDEDDFDDLDDDFDEFETDHEPQTSDSREYVPINLNNSEDNTSEESNEEDVTSSEETTSEE